MTSTEEKEDIRNKVRTGYADIAVKDQSCCGAAPTCCSGNTSKDGNTALAMALGYSAEDLAALPEGANLGLSCGNPTAMASLKEGETVLDLGSGGGFDVFVAARKVGPKGLAIGVDMTPEMLQKARNNSVKFRQRTGLENVDFRLGEIEHLPVADNSVDVVISNCVINLSPEKEQVWHEIARALKPGGRACVSDIALLQPLPDKLKESIHALVGCVAGAALIDDVVDMVKAAGLTVTSAERESVFVEEMAKSEDPLFLNIMKEVPEGVTPKDYVTSLKLVATKPEELH